MNGTEDKGKFRIDFKILSILLLLAAIPVLLGSWWLFKGYESAYLEMAGYNLSESADTALAYINSYLQNQIIVVAGLTEVPVVREAVKKGNLDLGKNLEEVRKAILDVQDIHSLIGSVRGGPSATAALIHAKGTVISAPGYSILDQATYPGTLEILNARERGRRYFISSASAPSIFGLPDSRTLNNFRELYPHLNWM